MTKSKLFRDIVHAQEQKYVDLVWYARSNPKRTDVTEEIRKQMIAKHAEVERLYPNETRELRKGRNADWEHGFNSGMLACLRLLMPYTLDKDYVEEFWNGEEMVTLTKDDCVVEAEEEFPNLNT